MHTGARAKEDFPYAMVLLAGIIGPLIAATFGNTPKSYADIPVFFAANEQSRSMGLEYSNQALKDLKPQWLETEPEKSEAVWEKLRAML